MTSSADMSGTALATQRCMPCSSSAMRAGFPNPNRVSSSRLVPISRSTPVAMPFATAARGCSGRNTPSTTGRKGSGTMPGSGRRLPISSVAATSSTAGIRSSDSRSHDAIPKTAAMRSADRSASATECTCTPPLCTIARRKSPLAPGVPSSEATLNAPADSPKIVTLAGSPPKAAMLSRTHISAACWSWMPQIAHEPVRIGQAAMTEETQRTKSVVDGDHDGIAVPHEVAPTVQEHRPAARSEPTPVNEDHDRPTPPVLRGRCLG